MHPNDGRVVSNFIVQALKGEPITLYGDGSQTRAFCYVDDMVDGFVRMMAAPDDITGPMNLGNPVETSIAELAELVVDLTGSSSRIDPTLPGYQPGERALGLEAAHRTALRYAADDRLFRGATQWLPRTAGRGGGRRGLSRATRLPRLAFSSTAPQEEFELAHRGGGTVASAKRMIAHLDGLPSQPSEIPREEAR